MAAPWLTLLPYGRQYQGGESIVQWQLVGSVAYSLLWPMTSILISMGRMWLSVWLCILYVGSYLGLGFWLIPKYGAAGYAAAGAGAFILANIPCVFLLFSRFSAVMRCIKWTVMLGLSSCLLGVCWLVSNFSFKMFSITAGLLAAAVFICWWIFTGKSILILNAAELVHPDSKVTVGIDTLADKR
jgi:O-antigen/teichoic acid export membrane protein